MSSSALTPNRPAPSGRWEDLVHDVALRRITVVTAAWLALFSVNIPNDVLRVVLGWASSAAYLAVAAVFSARAARRHRGQPALRFWASMTLACILFSVGNVLQMVSALGDPAGPGAIQSGTGTAVCGALAALVMIGVMLTYPVALASRLARVCFWLDLSTVFTAALTFGAYFSAGDLGSHSLSLTDWVLNLVAGPLVLLLALFGVVKLMLSGAAPFTRASGLLGAAATAVSGVSTGVTPQLVDVHLHHWFYGLGVLANALLLASARAQEITGRESGRRSAGRDRPRNSRLPYVAVGAAYSLLLAAFAREHLNLAQWCILLGATSCTVLVVLRQLAALADNERLAAELQFRAFHDGLTGLPNRTLFFDRLESALAQAQGTDTATVVLLIDLDDFKPINDRYGHDVGDAVLIAAAERMTAVVRASDTVARLGGDEFAVLLADSRQGALAGVVDRLLSAIQQPVPVGKVLAQVGASIGASIDQGARRDATALLKAADEAMYQAKCGGKRGYRIEGAETGDLGAPAGSFIP